MVFNSSAGADEALGRFSFFQNNQCSVHLPISWLLLAFPFNSSAGADEALGRFSFFQNNQCSVHLPISWLLLAFPFK